MSTNFCVKLSSQITDIRQVNREKSLAKFAFESLTDLRVSEAGRADLYSRCSHEDIIKHIVCRLDASEANYRNLHDFANLPDQAQGDRPDCRATQTARQIP